MKKGKNKKGKRKKEVKARTKKKQQYRVVQKKPKNPTKLALQSRSNSHTNSTL